MAVPDFPAVIPITVFRNAPFVRAPIVFRGVDFTGATAKMQVRLRPGAPGSPLLNLVTGGSGDALLLTSAVVDGLTEWSIKLVIDRSSIDALPMAGEAGKDPVFAYDLMISSSTLTLARWAEGPFIVHEGITT